MDDKKKEDSKEETKKSKVTLQTKHLNANLGNYLLLIMAVLLIGIFSPTGIIRAVFTAIFMYLYTFSIHCSATAFKPLADFLTKAGTTRLFNSELLGFSCNFGWLLWVLIGNYLVHRFTGVTILDNFIIIFWILLYSSVHLINFLFFKKSKGGGRELTELMDILTNKHQSKNVSTMGNPKINIILSTTLIVTGLLIVKQNPYIVTIPERYLRTAEDTILKFIFPNTNIVRHETRL